MQRVARRQLSQRPERTEHRLAHRSMHHQKMTTLPADLLPGDPDARGHHILDTLVDAFSNLMAASPAAFRPTSTVGR